MDSKFFRLLRYSIDESQPAPIDITDSDCAQLYRMATEQALLGVMFRGISLLPDYKRLDREVLMKWYTASRNIADLNMKVNRNAKRVANIFVRRGFRSCVLKGQGNALLYPDPYMRTPGDIDIWLEGGETRVLQLADKMSPHTKRCYHHVDFPSCGGIEVEVHYRPSFMNNLFANDCLQRYFAATSDIQFSHFVSLPDGVGQIAVPTASFNRIFQMAHISNHFFHEGIGLRQLLDYYYVLKQGFTDDDKQRDAAIFRFCGLYKIATAVMYVEQTVFGLEDSYLIVPPDSKRGRFLLTEIMRSGNFGQYDERINKARNNPIARNLHRCLRDLRFTIMFPSECLWEPIFRCYHFFWRRLH